MNAKEAWAITEPKRKDINNRIREGEEKELKYILEQVEATANKGGSYFTFNGTLEPWQIDTFLSLGYDVSTHQSMSLGNQTVIGWMPKVARRRSWVSNFASWLKDFIKYAYR